MWFMNHIANPVVRLILCSPFHTLLSGSMLLITIRGRKSGKAYTLPVQYVQKGDLIYILPGKPEKKTWWRNLRGGAPVRLRLRGQDCPAAAEILSASSDCDEILGALNLYLQRFPPMTRIHNIRRAPDGQLNSEDLKKAVSEVILVRASLTA